MPLTEHSNAHVALLQGNRNSIWVTVLREPFAGNCTLNVCEFGKHVANLRTPYFLSGVLSDPSHTVGSHTFPRRGEMLLNAP